MQRICFILGLVCLGAVTPLWAVLSEDPATITFETFLGQDPGHGNGQHTVVSFAAVLSADPVQLGESLADLPTGVTMVSVRCYVPALEESAWSGTIRRTFLVTDVATDLGVVDRLEAFIDSDPGYGAGIELALPVSQDGSAFRITQELDTSALDPGVHLLSVRTRDAVSGVWSGMVRRLFLVSPAVSSDSSASITTMEVFVGTAPQVGQGMVFEFGPGDVLDLSPDRVATLLQPGINVLGFRVKDSLERWSGVVRRLVYLSLDADADPVITHIEYRLAGISGAVPLTEPNGESGEMISLPAAYQLQAGQTYTLALAARDSLGRVGREVYVDFTPRDSFALWLGRHFSAEEIADGTLTALNADADGDGIPNFAEYAFGSDPRVAGAMPVLAMHSVDDSPEGNRLVVTYPRNPEARHYEWSFPATNDLGATWQPVSVEELAVTPVDGEREWVTVREVEPTSTDRHFLRVEVGPPLDQ